MMRRLHALAVTLILAACGGSASPTTAGTSPTSAAPQATATTAAVPDGTTTTIAVEPCVDEATEIDFEAATEVTIPEGERRVYLCVEVPNGVASLRFAVPDADGELTLYVGYPHLENVQQGGFEGFEFWQAQDQDGTWVIEMEPLVYSGGLLEEDTQDEFVRPGSYYIEVVGPAGTAITVTVSEA